MYLYMKFVSNSNMKGLIPISTHLQDLTKVVLWIITILFFEDAV